MRAIDLLHASIGGVSSRADKSVRFSVETAELTTEQAAVLLGYHGVAARVLVAPHEGGAVEIEEVRTSRDEKTPAQRLRGALYRLFEQEQKPGGDFEPWYRAQLERLIEDVKRKLNSF